MVGIVHFRTAIQSNENPEPNTQEAIKLNTRQTSRRYQEMRMRRKMGIKRHETYAHNDSDGDGTGKCAVKPNSTFKQ